jgi:hypothetical protein
MKKESYFILLIFIVSIGCYNPDEVYYGDGGINLRIINNTENTYTGKQSLYIGAVKNNKFYITDSISSNDIIQPQETTPIKGIQDWRPNTIKVKNISNKGVFLFIISNREQLFFKPFDFPKPPLDGSSLRVYIEEDGLIDPNGTIKQDYEIIK